MSHTAHEMFAIHAVPSPDELFEAIRENPVVRVPSDFVLVGRAFGLLSGIAHTLGSRANVLQAMGG